MTNQVHCLHCSHTGVSMKTIIGEKVSASWCANCEKNDLLITAPIGEDVQIAFIKFEKLLCQVLGREWTPSGISVESLINQIHLKLQLSAKAVCEHTIDRCDFGHTFAKAVDHPKAIGGSRCPNCMAIGLDKARALLKQHNIPH